MARMLKVGGVEIPWIVVTTFGWPLLLAVIVALVYAGLRLYLLAR